MKGYQPPNRQSFIKKLLIGSFLVGLFAFPAALPVGDAYLQDRIEAIQNELAGVGLGLKIYAVSSMAVDCTLVKLEDNSELLMPSPVYDRSERAQSYYNAPFEETRNREILKNVMLRHGFIQSIDKWWHFTIVS